MKIIDYQIGIVQIPLNKPFITALRRVDSVESIILTIKTDNGLIGYGSSAETKVITGDTKESIIRSIQIILDELKGEDLLAYNRIFEIISHSMIGNTSGKAAVDMAVYDVLAKFSRMPLYRYLGGSKRIIETDMTISMGEPQQMVSDSMEAFENGFKSLKIKLGDNPNADYVRMANIFKRLGNKVRYRIDANQGWSPKESVWVIGELENLGIDIELVEQPVHYHDFDGMKFVTDRVNVPILADESVFSFEEAAKIIQYRAADMINIKLMKTGGIYPATMIARLAKEKGVTCMIGSMMESPVSLHAAINFAMAYDSVKLFDLDVPCMYDPGDFKTAYTYGPVIVPSNQEGLGFSGINEKSLKII